MSGGALGASPLDKSPAPPTTTTMQPTKFAKLLRVVMPLVQGGLAGGFGGNWRVPGSGFQAARELNRDQQMIPFQQQELQERIRAQRAQEGLEAARVKALGDTGEQRTIDRAVDGQVHTFQYNPKSGTYDTDLGPSGRMAERANRNVIRETDAGFMSMDPESGEATPVENMAPEKTGSLPLPNEPEVAPLQAPQKQIAAQRPVTLGEGQELVDPKTGQVITPARPRTSAPRSPRTGRAMPDKPDVGQVQHYAEEFMQRSGGNADLAIRTMNALQSLPDAQKEAIEKRMREMAKPVAKSRNFLDLLSPTEKAKLQRAPANQ